MARHPEQLKHAAPPLARDNSLVPLPSAPTSTRSSADDPAPAPLPSSAHLQALQADADFLWHSALISYREQRFQGVVTALNRLLKDHLESPHVLEAHYYLGQAYLGLTQPQQAERELQTFIESQTATYQAPANLRLACSSDVLRATPSSASLPELLINAQLALGQAYLQLQKFSQAHLLSFELNAKLAPALRSRFAQEELQGESQKKCAEELVPSPAPTALEIAKLKTRLLQIRALQGLAKSAQAEELLDHLPQGWQTQADAPLQAEIAQLQLQFQLGRCTLLQRSSTSSRPFGSEGALIAALKQHQQCLLQALLLIDPWLANPAPPIQAALRQLREVYQQTLRFAQAPPLPMKRLAAGERRTARQASVLAQELQVVLQTTLLQPFFKTSLELLQAHLSATHPANLALLEGWMQTLQPPQAFPRRTHSRRPHPGVPQNTDPPP